MLSLDAEVRDALDVFEGTYRPRVNGGRIQIERMAFPRAGGLDEQDPRLMAMLGEIERHTIDILNEDMRSSRRRAELKATKEKRGRARRRH